MTDISTPRTPRVVFAERFAALYAAAGNPTLRRVATAAEARMRAAKSKGNTGGASAQRISDWRSGRNVPARFESLLPVLLTLIELSRRARVSPAAELVDLQQWRRWWSAANTWDADADEDDVPCPYPGLTSYTTDTAEMFFGRSRPTAELIELVRDAVEAGDGSGPIVLLGASGAGKSSLLAAGIVPGLTDPAQTWTVATMTPGADPLVALMKAIGGDETQADVVAVTEAVTAWGTESRRLLIVDQFEELFTACGEETIRADFLAVLEACLACRLPYPTAVVLAVRADFYAQCLEYRLLEDALKDRSYLLGPMRPDELAEAITRPAELAGFKLEPGLEELVITELCGLGGREDRHSYDPGALPLLSHVMAAAWQRRDGRRITLAGYRKAGGVAGSVAATAELAWSELSEPEQRAAEQLLLGLVSVGDDSRDTRRIIGSVELQARAADPDDAATALERLVRARLVTLDSGSAYFTHEIVLNAWPRLRAWISEGRVGHLVRQRLHADAGDWHKAGRDPSLLYRGMRLATADEHTDPPPVDGPAGEFLAASRAANRTLRRRGAAMKAGLAMLGTVVLVLGLLAYGQNRLADRERLDGDFAAVLAAADRVQSADPSLSAQLDLVAHDLRPTDPEVRARLLQTESLPLATSVSAQAGAVVALAYRPDGRVLASLGNDNDPTIRFWDVADPTRPHPIGRPLTSGSAFFGQPAFSPDGGVFAAGAGDGDVRLWDVRDPAHPRLLNGRIPQTGSQLAFSPDGRILAVPTSHRGIALWDISDPDRPTAIGSGLPVQNPDVDALRFSRDGHRLAVVSDDVASAYSGLDGPKPVDPGTDLQWWDISDPTSAVPLGAPTQVLAQSGVTVAFTPDLTSLAVANGMGTVGRDDVAVALWDIADPLEPVLSHTLQTRTKDLSTLSFSPGGATLMTSTADGVATLWSLADSPRPEMLGYPLAAGSEGVFSATFSPDGRTAVTGSDKGTVRLWSLPTAIVADEHVAKFSHDGHRMASVNANESHIQLWDTRDMAAPHKLGELDPQLSFIALSPDGRTVVVTARPGGPLRLFDIAEPAAPRLLAELDTPSGPSSGVTFSPNSRLLVTGTDGHSIQVWDLADRSNPTPLGRPVSVFSGLNYRQKFSPDGRMLVTAGFDETPAGVRPDRIELWDMSNPAHPTQLSADVGMGAKQINDFAISPDSRTLVTTGDETIQLWDMSNPRKVTPIGEPLVGHSKTVDSVAFSPDGRTLASGGEESTVRLWDITDRAHPTLLGPSITPPAAFGWGVEFDPAGGYLIGSTPDGALRVWDLDARHAVTRICDVTGTLTRDQWHE